MVKITKEAALLYHSQGKPGKIEVVPTKPYQTQRDLSLAYSPGVAEPCLEIQKNPDTAYDYTDKGNLVAVISNGTAVLGLGDIGAMSGKPVMEGKGLLFKIYAGIDVFDIEVNEKDPDKFIEAVKAIAPTFGGINLEDIKAPECFKIEQRLKEELDIPVMHDDQHGTAIISSAGLLNALEVAGKKIEEVKDCGKWSRSFCRIMHQTLHLTGSATGKHPDAGQQRGHNQRAYRPERTEEILCDRPHRCTYISRSHQRRRCIPGTFQRECPDTRHGTQHGFSPDCFRIGKPDTRNFVRRRHGITPGCINVDRTF